jgi:CRP-like cAMP-binding protein
VDVTAETGLHEVLQGVFACSADTADSIARRMSDRRYPVRAIILNQGDRSEATFLVIAGRAHALSNSIDGQLVLMHEFLPGDFFGAIAEPDPAPEDADVVAVEEVRAGVFLAMDFLTLIESHGCVALTVSRMLLRRLRTTAVRMVERTTLSAAGRVHAELLRMARLGDGQTLQPVPVMSALAVRAHTTRETVSRTIHTLERRGIVRREGDALIIVAQHRLEDMMI